MKKKGNNKKKSDNMHLIIIIIVLSVCLVVLGGYVVYDLFNKNVLCDGCNGDVAPVEDLSPISEMENRLGISVPILYEEIDSYSVYNEGWPYYASISFGNDNLLEITKDFDNLFISKNEYMSVSKDIINNIEVTIYSDSSDDGLFKAAVWKYNDIYYAFQIEKESSLNFDDCVENLIMQVINQ